MNCEQACTSKNHINCSEACQMETLTSQ